MLRVLSRPNINLQQLFPFVFKATDSKMAQEIFLCAVKMTQFGHLTEPINRDDLCRAIASSSCAEGGCVRGPFYPVLKGKIRGEKTKMIFSSYRFVLTSLPSVPNRSHGNA